MSDSNPDIIATDDDGNELDDASVEVNGTVPGGGGDGDGDGEGAAADASYVTTEDESEDLPESTEHSDLSGDDLHEPAEHGNDAHSVAFLSDGDGVERDVWLISAGADDPEEAGPEDIILEEED